MARIIISLAFLLFTAPAWAIPQFPARHGPDCQACHKDPEKLNIKIPPWYERKCSLNCVACHINPTGGGMRNRAGNYFHTYTLPMNLEKEEKVGKVEPPEHQHHDKNGEDNSLFGEDDHHSTALSKFVSFGGDFRFAYIHSDSESESAFKDAFFPMQADLYVNFTPSQNLLFYYMQGLQGNRETFGLWHNFLPGNIYLKFGKFIPPYGLKIDDHTAFIRDKLGLGTNRPENADVGMETGFSLLTTFLNAAVFNGNGSSGLDNDREKGFSATGGIRGLYASIAFSVYDNNTPTDQKTFYGVYGTLHHRDLTWLGEYDRMHKTKGNIFYNELDYMLKQGLILKVKHEYFDPGRGEIQKRISPGFDYYPYPHVEISFLYRINLESPDKNNNQTLFYIHLFF